MMNKISELLEIFVCSKHCQNGQYLQKQYKYLVDTDDTINL